jgi:hypothetical protein
VTGIDFSEEDPAADIFPREVVNCYGQVCNTFIQGVGTRVRLVGLKGSSISSLTCTYVNEGCARGVGN